MSTVTASQSVICLALKDVLEAATSLGLQDVWYGDQRLIPRTPAVCIEPNMVHVEGAGTHSRVSNMFETLIICYFADIANQQWTRQRSDELAEAIRDELNIDKQLGGLITYGFVTSIEYGYAARETLMFAARVTYSGITRTQL